MSDAKFAQFGGRAAMGDYVKGGINEGQIKNFGKKSKQNKIKFQPYRIGEG